MSGWSKLQSASQHDFAQVPRVNIPRSVFNRSSRHMTAFDEDYLIPIFVDEVVPGDSMSMDFSYFARLSTPIAPIMSNLYLDYFFFYCPTRIVWNNFRKLLGEQDNPGDSTSYTMPVQTNPGGSGYGFVIS